jgi:glycerophosphoryl diester phosphodiesterase
MGVAPKVVARRVVIVLLLGVVTSLWWPIRLPSERLIAHALGEINGETYTNSREAFYENHARGFRWFEVDLMLTADSQVVAAHDPRDLERVPSLGLTLLRLDDVIALAQQCVDCRFVLDVKDGGSWGSPTTFAAIHRRIAERGPTVIERLIPQVYADQDVATVRAIYGPSQSLILTLYRSRANDAEVVAIARRTAGLVFVTAPANRVIRGLPVPLFIHTVNLPGQARWLLNRGATGLYTDRITPRDFRDR